ncbi:MAG: TIR domain-containing protein [Bryobacteraceae bacterium]|jgi:predicted nucleotide-binding protein
MPSKKVYFRSVKFRPQDLKEAKASFLNEVPTDIKKEEGRHFSVCSGDTTWNFEDEDEFYSAYRDSNTTEAIFNVSPGYVRLYVHYNSDVHRNYSGYTIVDIALPTRSQIEHVFEVFEAAKQACSISIPIQRQLPRIFIGHGRHTGWRDLKDHLHEKHGFDVDAYETGARAGYSIKEFLEQAQVDDGFALLVHSAEDEDTSGGLHARENVIHETGLFQGRLGFRRAIVLREDGCQEFSNLMGVQEIRFSKANIRETFGEVLATIRREFGDRGEQR